MPFRKYETVTGYFVQDDPRNAVPTIPQLPPRFGLVDESPARWDKFKGLIERLNLDAPSNIRYKVFFLGRHGQGVHNVAEAKYGTKACMGRQYGDDELTWGPDPELTDLGEEQAKSALAVWKAELAFGIPLPDKLYSSPLTRAIRTNQITFFEGLIKDGRKATIVENMREENGVHTCDMRRTRSYIQERFPEYQLEHGFTEEDGLWKADVRENPQDIERRAARVLDMIFENDQEQFICITSHGGFIGAFLRVSGHRSWPLQTGGVIPVVIKASTQFMN
ncbi:histidine phosphatase superfamily [Phlebopus sp. FC_14]|nr:histidine phosphatase superfamily [Phlebopus sp. FC_14]